MNVLSVRGLRVHLLLRKHPQIATDFGQPGIVLVERFLRTGIVLHGFQHQSILLQNLPVQALQPVLVEEPPDIAFPSGDLANPPEVNLAHLLGHRSDKTDDNEIASRTRVLAVGDLQAQPERKCVCLRRLIGRLNRPYI